jgi:hypothetical protein
MKTLGLILVAAGVVVLLMRGVSYVKDRDDVEVGPVRFSKVERGFIPPVAGLVAVVIGGALILAAGRRSR